MLALEILVAALGQSEQPIERLVVCPLDKRRHLLDLDLIQLFDLFFVRGHVDVSHFLLLKDALDAQHLRLDLLEVNIRLVLSRLHLGLRIVVGLVQQHRDLALEGLDPRTHLLVLVDALCEGHPEYLGVSTAIAFLEMLLRHPDTPFSLAGRGDRSVV